jgi:hypothetical protein
MRAGITMQPVGSAVLRVAGVLAAVVLAALMVFVALGWNQSPCQNPRRATESMLGLYRNEIMLYGAVHEQLPPEHGWCELVHEEACSHPTDAWGNPYQFKHKGNKFDFELRSAGADGRLGTTDDQVSVFTSDRPAEPSDR